MRKTAIFMLGLMALGACSKHDPILPGVRDSIFDSPNVTVTNQKIKNLPANAGATSDTDCPYTQDRSNVIWNGDKKVFSGFPTNNSVKSDQKPVCSGEFVYAGLTTGELVKVNGKTRKIIWIADIYRDSNLTGGASVLDIVAPIVVNDDAIYVGGLGDAFCRINPKNGAKKWCATLSVSKPFIVAGPAAFVVAGDKYLYAINTADGTAYWRVAVDEIAAPEYRDGVVRVGRNRIDAQSGTKIK